MLSWQGSLAACSPALTDVNPHACAAIAVWHSSRNAAAMPASKRLVGLERTMGQMVSLEPAGYKGRPAPDLRWINIRPRREPTDTYRRAALAPSRPFASSNARMVASTSYGTSSKVTGFHSLRGVAKKSPP